LWKFFEDLLTGIDFSQLEEVFGQIQIGWQSGFIRTLGFLGIGNAMLCYEML
jgi:hypothetical protein